MNAPLKQIAAWASRQTRALANEVREKVKAAGGEVVGLEGEETGQWIGRLDEK